MDNLALQGIAADWWHIYTHGVRYVNRKPLLWREKYASNIEKFSQKTVYNWAYGQRQPLEKFLATTARHTRSEEDEERFRFCVQSFVRKIQAEFAQPWTLCGAFSIDEMSFPWGERNAGIFSHKGYGRALKRLQMSNARGGVTLVVICDTERIRRIRIIFERAYFSRNDLRSEIEEVLGDIPSCVEISCQAKHWMDTRIC